MMKQRNPKVQKETQNPFLGQAKNGCGKANLFGGEIRYKYKNLLALKTCLPSGTSLIMHAFISADRVEMQVFQLVQGIRTCHL